MRVQIRDPEGFAAMLRSVMEGNTPRGRGGVLFSGGRTTV